MTLCELVFLHVSPVIYRQKRRHAVLQGNALEPGQTREGCKVVINSSTTRYEFKPEKAVRL